MNEENFVNSQDVYADSDLQGSNGTTMDVGFSPSPPSVPQTQSASHDDVASTPSNRNYINTSSTGQTQQKNKQRSKRKGSKKKKTNKKTNKKTAPPKD